MKLAKNTHHSELELINAIRAQTRQGAETLYKLYKRNLYNVIKRIIFDEKIAEDILQLTIVKIWTSFDQYDPEKGRLIVWMAQIARNLATDELRSKHRQNAAVTDRIDEAHKTLQIVDRAVFNMDRHDVHQLFKQLNSDQTKIIRLVYISGYTHAETALTLGIPIGTVKTRIRAAINILRAYLSGEIILPAR